MSETLFIKAELLVAIARWSDPGINQPTLSAVYFAGDELVATDAHRLVRVPYDCRGQRFAMRRGDVFAAWAAQNALNRHHSEFAMKLDADVEASADGESVFALNDRELGIRWDGKSTVTVGLGDSQLICPTGSYQLPDIDKVMMARPEGGIPWGRGFDIRYLAGIEDVVRAAGYSRRATTIEAWSDEIGPFQFSCPTTGDHPIRFVIMPIVQPASQTGSRRNN